MDLTAIQHRHASALWNKLRLSSRTEPEDRIASSTRAFTALGLLNLPAPAIYHVIKARATRQALLEWPQTWNAKWIAHYFPDKKASLLADHISSRVRVAIHAFTSRMVLSPSTMERNRWWTLITANFTHFNLSHLLGNMLALNAVGPACAEVAGMTPFHVFGIAVTTSLVTGLQALYRLSGTTDWTTCGFSAVLCAFTSVGALGAPQPEPDASGKYPSKARSVWTVAAMQIATDVVSLMRANSGRTGPRTGHTESVDYVAHLIGYACGAAYYAFFLWRESADDKEVEVEVEDENEKVTKEPVGVINEYLRTRNQPAPVKESEDWEDVASQLGYSAPGSEGSSRS